MILLLQSFIQTTSKKKKDSWRCVHSPVCCPGKRTCKKWFTNKTIAKDYRQCRQYWIYIPCLKCSNCFAVTFSNLTFVLDKCFIPIFSLHFELFVKYIQYTQGHIVIDVRRVGFDMSDNRSMETGAIKRVINLESWANRCN